MWNGQALKLLRCAALRPRPVQMSHKSNMSTLYDVLGVRRDASAESLKQAFYSKAKRLHPDVNPARMAGDQQFQQLAAAYEVLSDHHSRQQYDEELRGKEAESASKSRPVFRGNTWSGRARPEVHRREGVPVMRSVEVDLSAERMQKAWEAYKVRWEREEERLREMEQKKIKFRQHVDAVRAGGDAKALEEMREDMRLFRVRPEVGDNVDKKDAKAREESAKVDDERDAVFKAFLDRWKDDMVTQSKSIEDDLKAKEKEVKGPSEIVRDEKENEGRRPLKRLNVEDFRDAEGVKREQERQRKAAEEAAFHNMHSESEEGSGGKSRMADFFEELSSNTKERLKNLREQQRDARPMEWYSWKSFEGVNFGYGLVVVGLLFLFANMAVENLHDFKSMTHPYLEELKKERREKESKTSTEKDVVQS